MKTSIRALALLMVLMFVLSAQPIDGRMNGIHNQAAAGCTCHNPNAGGLSATHDFPTQYTAGMFYSITIGHTGGTQAFVGGFNVVVSDGSLGNPGTGVKIDSSTLSATHTTSGQLGWTFDWTTPAPGTGTVTVNLAVLQGDGNQANSGDAWDNLQFTITEIAAPNNPPSAANVLISPSTNGEAPTDASLTLAYDFSDPEGDSELNSVIKWYVDGTHAPSHNNKKTIAATSTTVGQKWKAEVTPSDGTDEGQAEMSNEVTIIDIDSDGDGVDDGQDAFPNDSTETVDTDGDGVGDNGDAFPNDASQSADQDGDGYGDNPQGTNPDMFKTDATQWADADNDGYGDNPDGTNADLFPADATEWFDSDLDGVGDNADAFPNDPDETMDSDGDGMGDNEQAVLEAKLAAEQEEADASARMRMIIGAVLVLLVGAGAGVFYLRSRSAADGVEDVVKDFGMPDMNAQPATSMPDMYAQPAQSYGEVAGYAAQPAAAAYDPMATQPAASQPIDDSALSTLIEPEPVAAAAVAMPEAVVAPVAAEPAVVAPVEPSVVNQWTDENGHTWRVMSDGTNRWWNGTDWQKV